MKVVQEKPTKEVGKSFQTEYLIFTRFRLKHSAICRFVKVKIRQTTWLFELQHLDWGAYGGRLQQRVFVEGGKHCFKHKTESETDILHALL